MRVSFALRVIAFLILIIFSTETLVWSAPEPVYRLQIAEGLGIVKERWQSDLTPASSGVAVSPQSNKKSIILIQDAHENFGVQTNIARLLETLTGQWGKDNLVIGVEGAFEEIDIATFRQFPIFGARDEAARNMVRNGYFSGAEYAAITSNHELPIWGVEDKKLLYEDFRQFYAIRKNQVEIQTALEVIEQELKARAKLFFNPELKAFSSELKKIRKQEGTLLESMIFLRAQAARHEVSREQFTYWPLFDEIHALSAKVDEKAIAVERKKLAAWLRQEGWENEENLLVSSQSGKVSGEDEALMSLWQEAARRRADLPKEFPALNAQFTLSRKLALLDFQSLQKEAREVAAAIKRKLAKTPEERKIILQESQLESLGSLIHLNATRSEVKRFFVSLNSVELTSESFLHDPSFEKLQPYLERARQFYELAQAREKAMLDNLLAKMEKDKKQMGILVAGGYHAEGLAELLRKQNTAYVTIVPNIQNPEDKALYLERMLGNILPLPTFLTSYLRVSQINMLFDAVIEADPSARGTLELILNSFGTQWRAAVNGNESWADKLALMQDYSDQLPDAVRTRVQEPLDVLWKIIGSITSRLEMKEQGGSGEVKVEAGETQQARQAVEAVKTSLNPEQPSFAVPAAPAKKRSVLEIILFNLKRPMASIVLFFVLFLGVSLTSQAAEITERTTSDGQKQRVAKVEKGDNLWKLAGKRWQQVYNFSENNFLKLRKGNKVGDQFKTQVVMLREGDEVFLDSKVSGREEGPAILVGGTTTQGQGKGASSISLAKRIAPNSVQRREISLSQTRINTGIESRLPADEAASALSISADTAGSTVSEEIGEAVEPFIERKLEVKKPMAYSRSKLSFQRDDSIVVTEGEPSWIKNSLPVLKPGRAVTKSRPASRRTPATMSRTLGANVLANEVNNLYPQIDRWQERGKLMRSIEGNFVSSSIAYNMKSPEQGEIRDFNARKVFYKKGDTILRLVSPQLELEWETLEKEVKLLEAQISESAGIENDLELLEIRTELGTKKSKLLELDRLRQLQALVAPRDLLVIKVNLVENGKIVNAAEDLITVKDAAVFGATIRVPQEVAENFARINVFEKTESKWVRRPVAFYALQEYDSNTREFVVYVELKLPEARTVEGQTTLRFDFHRFDGPEMTMPQGALLFEAAKVPVKSRPENVYAAQMAGTYQIAVQEGDLIEKGELLATYELSGAEEEQIKLLKSEIERLQPFIEGWNSGAFDFSRSKKQALERQLQQLQNQLSLLEQKKKLAQVLATQDGRVIELDKTRFHFSKGDALVHVEGAYGTLGTQNANGDLTYAFNVPKGRVNVGDRVVISHRGYEVQGIIRQVIGEVVTHGLRTEGKATVVVEFFDPFSVLRVNERVGKIRIFRASETDNLASKGMIFFIPGLLGILGFGDPRQRKRKKRVSRASRRAFVFTTVGYTVVAGLTGGSSVILAGNEPAPQDKYPEATSVLNLEPLLSQMKPVPAELSYEEARRLTLENNFAIGMRRSEAEIRRIEEEIETGKFKGGRISGQIGFQNNKMTGGVGFTGILKFIGEIGLGMVFQSRNPIALGMHVANQVIGLIRKDEKKRAEFASVLTKIALHAQDQTVEQETFRASETYLDLAAKQKEQEAYSDYLAQADGIFKTVIPARLAARAISAAERTRLESQVSNFRQTTIRLNSEKAAKGRQLMGILSGRDEDLQKKPEVNFSFDPLSYSIISDEKRDAMISQAAGPASLVSEVNVPMSPELRKHYWMWRAASLAGEFVKRGALNVDISSLFLSNTVTNPLIDLPGRGFIRSGELIQGLNNGLSFSLEFGPIRKAREKVAQEGIDNAMRAYLAERQKVVRHVIEAVENMNTQAALVQELQRQVVLLDVSFRKQAAQAGYDVFQRDRINASITSRNGEELFLPLGELREARLKLVRAQQDYQKNKAFLESLKIQMDSPTRISQSTRNHDISPFRKMLIMLALAVSIAFGALAAPFHASAQAKRSAPPPTVAADSASLANPFLDQSIRENIYDQMDDADLIRLMASDSGQRQAQEIAAVLENRKGIVALARVFQKALSQNNKLAASYALRGVVVLLEDSPELLSQLLHADNESDIVSLLYTILQAGSANNHFFETAALNILRAQLNHEKIGGNEILDMDTLAALYVRARAEDQNLKRMLEKEIRIRLYFQSRQLVEGVQGATEDYYLDSLLNRAAVWAHYFDELWTLASSSLGDTWKSLLPALDAETVANADQLFNEMTLPETPKFRMIGAQQLLSAFQYDVVYGALVLEEQLAYPEDLAGKGRFSDLARLALANQGSADRILAKIANKWGAEGLLASDAKTTDARLKAQIKYMLDSRLAEYVRQLSEKIEDERAKATFDHKKPGASVNPAALRHLMDFLEQAAQGQSQEVKLYQRMLMALKSTHELGKLSRDGNRAAIGEVRYRAVQFTVNAFDYHDKTKPRDADTNLTPNEIQPLLTGLRQKLENRFTDAAYSHLQSEVTAIGQGKGTVADFARTLVKTANQIEEDIKKGTQHLFETDVTRGIFARINRFYHSIPKQYRLFLVIGSPLLLLFWFFKRLFFYSSGIDTYLQGYFASDESRPIGHYKDEYQRMLIAWAELDNRLKTSQERNSVSETELQEVGRHLRELVQVMVVERLRPVSFVHVQLTKDLLKEISMRSLQTAALLGELAAGLEENEREVSHDTMLRSYGLVLTAISRYSATFSSSLENYLEMKKIKADYFFQQFGYVGLLISTFLLWPVVYFISMIKYVSLARQLPELSAQVVAGLYDSQALKAGIRPRNGMVAFLMERLSPVSNIDSTIMEGLHVRTGKAASHKAHAFRRFIHATWPYLFASSVLILSYFGITPLSHLDMVNRFLLTFTPAFVLQFIALAEILFSHRNDYKAHIKAIDFLEADLQQAGASEILITGYLPDQIFKAHLHDTFMQAQAASSRRILVVLPKSQREEFFRWQKSRSENLGWKNIEPVFIEPRGSGVAYYEVLRRLMGDGDIKKTETGWQMQQGVAVIFAGADHTLHGREYSDAFIPLEFQLNGVPSVSLDLQVATALAWMPEQFKGIMNIFADSFYVGPLAIEPEADLSLQGVRGSELQMQREGLGLLSISPGNGKRSRLYEQGWRDHSIMTEYSQENPLYQPDLPHVEQLDLFSGLALLNGNSRLFNFMVEKAKAVLELAEEGARFDMTTDVFIPFLLLSQNADSKSLDGYIVKRVSLLTGEARKKQEGYVRRLYELYQNWPEHELRTMETGYLDAGKRLQLPVQIAFNFATHVTTYFRELSAEQGYDLYRAEMKRILPEGKIQVPKRSVSETVVLPVKSDKEPAFTGTAIIPSVILQMMRSLNLNGQKPQWQRQDWEKFIAAFSNRYGVVASAMRTRTAVQQKLLQQVQFAFTSQNLQQLDNLEQLPLVISLAALIQLADENQPTARLLMEAVASNNGHKIEGAFDAVTTTLIRIAAEKKNGAQEIISDAVIEAVDGLVFESAIEAREEMTKTMAELTKRQDDDITAMLIRIYIDPQFSKPEHAAINEILSKYQDLIRGIKIMTTGESDDPAHLKLVKEGSKLKGVNVFYFSSDAQNFAAELALFVPVFGKFLAIVSQRNLAAEQVNLANIMGLWVSATVKGVSINPVVREKFAVAQAKFISAQSFNLAA